MPRRTRLRSVDGEANLARRIQREREHRGWSYETLAKKMTATGCRMQGSAIYRLEKADPPRRITVDELIAFARVFDVDVENLLTPVEVLRTERAQQVVKKIDVYDRELYEVVGNLTNTYAEYFDLAAYEPDLREYVDNHRFRSKVAKESIEKSSIRAMVTTHDGKEINLDVDDSQLVAGLTTLYKAILATAGQVATAAIEENKTRGIGSSPLEAEDDS